MSIYVTVPSNGGGSEFGTTNTNVRFKVRLLERLQLKRGDWQVALASISLPSTDTVIGNLLKRFPSNVTIGVKGGMISYVEEDKPASDANPYKYATVIGTVTMADLLMDTDITDGYSLVQHLIVQLSNKLNVARQAKVAALKLTAPSGKGVFRVKMAYTHASSSSQNQEMEQLNQFDPKTITISAAHQNDAIYTAIHVDLAIMMGFIKNKTEKILGPNLRLTFRSADFVNLESALDFFRTGTHVKLKGNVNWNLYGMRSGWFEREFVDFNRTLRVFSNANASSMIGNQVTDVLREVNLTGANQGELYFEPKHRQYLQVRQQEFEIIEIALDDLKGQHPSLGKGTTSVVLHFKQIEKEDGA